MKPGSARSVPGVAAVAAVVVAVAVVDPGVAAVTAAGDRAVAVVPVAVAVAVAVEGAAGAGRRLLLTPVAPLERIFAEILTCCHVRSAMAAEQNFDRWERYDQRRFKSRSSH